MFTYRFQIVALKSCERCHKLHARDESKLEELLVPWSVTNSEYIHYWGPYPNPYQWHHCDIYQIYMSGIVFLHNARHHGKNTEMAPFDTIRSNHKLVTELYQSMKPYVLKRVDVDCSAYNKFPLVS